MKRNQILSIVLGTVLAFSSVTPVMAADTGYVNASDSMKNILDQVRSDYADAQKNLAYLNAATESARTDMLARYQEAKDAISQTQKDANTALDTANKNLDKANKTLKDANDKLTKANADQKTASDAYYAAVAADTAAQDNLTKVNNDKSAKTSAKEAAQEAADKAEKALTDAKTAKDKADRAQTSASNAQKSADNAVKNAQKVVNSAKEVKIAADALTPSKESDYKGFQDRTPNLEIEAYLDASDAYDDAKEEAATAQKDLDQKKTVLDSVEKALDAGYSSDKIDIKDAKISTVASVVYSGAAQEPTTTVTYGDKTLVSGTDYVISYTQNVNVGTATVSVIGKGDYTGSISTTFKITAQAIKEISSATNVTDTTATVTVLGADGKTVDASNYDVTVVKATGGKSATVTVTGKNNYSGSAAKTVDLTKVTPVAPVTTDTTALYRVYNPNSGEHFYTKSAAERDHLVAVGWNDEGIGWYAPTTSSTPVYRVYNPNSGDHHYTTNAGEKDALVKLGWNDEGIGWYAASSTDTNAIPVYRQYNPNAKTGAHNFTTSKAENDHLKSVGWNEEGIAWYSIQK